MTTAQKIYQAIELFSIEEPHFGRFKLTFREALIDHGAPAANAGEMAEVAAKSLRQHENRDYHLGMAMIIAQSQGFESAMGSSPEAFQAMHKYMSYYLDYADLQQVAAVN